MGSSSRVDRALKGITKHTITTLCIIAHKTHPETQYKDTQHNDIQNNNTQHNNIKHKEEEYATHSTMTLSIMALNTEYCSAECRLC